MFAWYFSILLSFWSEVYHRRSIFGLCFVVHSANLCLLIRILIPFVINAIIDILGLSYFYFLFCLSAFHFYVFSFLSFCRLLKIFRTSFWCVYSYFEYTFLCTVYYWLLCVLIFLPLRDEQFNRRDRYMNKSNKLCGWDNTSMWVIQKDSSKYIQKRLIYESVTGMVCLRN